MIKHNDKIWYMWQYMNEVYFNKNDHLWWDYEDISDLRKIKFRLWELIIYFNHLEHGMESILCDLLWWGGQDETWMMIIWNMSYKQKCVLLKKYWLRRTKLSEKVWYKKLYKKIENFIKELLIAWEIRNSCVHAHRYDRQEKWNVRIKTNFDENWVKITYRDMNIDTLDEYINFIYNIEYFLDDLKEEIDRFY